MHLLCEIKSSTELLQSSILSRKFEAWQQTEENYNVLCIHCSEIPILVKVLKIPPQTCFSLNLVLRNLELIEKQVWDSCQEYCILSPSCHPENATGVSKLVVVQTNSILKEELEIFSRVLSPTIVSLKESGEWSLNRFVKKRKDEQKNTCVSNN